MNEMPQKLYDVFCENVRERMKFLKLSQADLAAKLGVSQSYISQILSGHRRPGLDSLELFAKALKVEPPDLLKKMSGVA
jgi:transcriptional regulator with XRE-family HTH domain